MKLIKPDFKILDQQCGLEGVYKQIEVAGRTCYKSEDKITQDSAKGFVDRMVKSKHLSMLEHGTVYLDIPFDYTGAIPTAVIKYIQNPYSKLGIPDGYACGYITTNYRVLVENDWLGDLKFLCEPTDLHERRVTVRFTTDRGVSHKRFVA